MLKAVVCQIMISKASILLSRRLQPPCPPPGYLTATQLAKELGVSRQAVCSWLYGRARPSPRLMAKIEDLMGITMREWTEAGE